MKPVFLYLPWPPTVNSYYGFTRGVKYVRKEGRAFRERCEKDLMEQVGRLAIGTRINLEVVLYPPDGRRRDLDNHMKALLDACTIAGLWEDDSLIDQLTVLRGCVVKGGLARLEVNEAGPLVSKVSKDRL
jgi:crossover junction endodeoxyribonuclease RusA